MARAGWYKQYRAIFDHPVLSGDVASRVHAFSDLVGMAEFEPTRRRVGTTLVELERGQLLASVRYLAERWKWSKAKVQRFLGCLERESMVSTANETPAGTVYLVVNYDAYQGGEDSERDTKRDSNGTPARQQRDKEEEVKNVKEGQLKIHPLRATEAVDPEHLITLAIRAANCGMADNPLIDQHRFRPILAQQGQSRETAREWLEAGYGWDAVLETIYFAAKDYKPGERQSQILNLRYFINPIRDRMERDAAAATVRPKRNEIHADAEVNRVRSEQPGAERVKQTLVGTQPLKLARLFEEMEKKGFAVPNRSASPDAENVA